MWNLQKKVKNFQIKTLIYVVLIRFWNPGLSYIYRYSTFSTLSNMMKGGGWLGEGSKFAVQSSNSNMGMVWPLTSLYTLFIFRLIGPMTSYRPTWLISWKFVDIEQKNVRKLKWTRTDRCIRFKSQKSYLRKWVKNLSTINTISILSFLKWRHNN